MAVTCGTNSGATLGQPCLSFPIYSHQLWIVDEETFTFRIKSTYPGEQVLVSQAITVTITCSSSYSVVIDTTTYVEEAV